MILETASGSKNVRQCCAGDMPPARSILPYKKPNYTVQLQNHEIQVRLAPSFGGLYLESDSGNRSLSMQEDLDKVTRGSLNGASKRSNRRPVPSTQYFNSESPPHN